MTGSRNGDDALYVVGIGASAGGLDALEKFFDNVPNDTGMAFVVVQHLSPDFKSVMDELLARHTELPVRHVEDAMEIEPNHVYLIPPRKEMIISGRRLLLRERDSKQELALPIDVFFRSLARECGPRGIAIVLSGGGSDGSRGIRDVYEAGGLVLVQDTASAQFDGMPKAASDVGVAHGVLPPQAMPGMLVEHARKRAEGHPDGAGARGAALQDETTRPPEGIDALYGILEAEFGIDFTHYKPSTVTRRIERRLGLSRTEDIEAYVERLRRDRAELDTLYRDLLIGVTRFFRNEEAFDVLERHVLPDLFRRAAPDVPVRVWVAGCATGEEVYSLAILLQELSERHGGRPVKIFATDVHPGSLQIASRGLYHEESLVNMRPDRLERFFVRSGKNYQVVPELRQMAVFAQHNVIRDAPFTRVDLVSCRNLLIYLQPHAQQKVLSLFHFALNRGGVLLLGSSETPGALLRDFQDVDRHWRIYRKFSDVRLAVDGRVHAPKAALGGPRPIESATSPRLSVAALLSTYDALLEEVMPPSLLLNDFGELVHAFGGASRFLKLRDGRLGLDVLELVDPELKMLLAGGLQRAKKERTGIVFKGVRLEPSGEAAGNFDVTIRPVQVRSGPSPSLLVSFAPCAAPAREAPAPTKQVDLTEVSREQLGNLELELTYTKENLQATIEELEASNEELQTANEELLSSNEELQSTNEELQSVNEELYTVNAEYQRKIDELTELANDMNNLLSSTEIGTIFLDAKLRIRKFTPRIAESFELVSHDVGRSIETFAHSLAHPALLEDLRSVLSKGERVEREVEDKSGRVYFMRLLPYRVKGTVDGVVLTLIDVSVLKSAEKEIREAVRRRDEFLAMLSHELRNPLAAVVAATALLKVDDGKRNEGGRLVKVIDRQTRHMSRLLDDLLDASRVTQNKIELKRHIVDLRAVARDAVDAARGLMDARRLHFDVDIDGEPLPVDGDPARLQQIQANLLSNAAKYTDVGGHVWLSLRREGQEAVIRVRDNGIGMRPDTIDAMFELFAQGPSSLDRAPGGLGVGLMLVRAFVTMHGGTVTARSGGEGLGSEFVVRLPLASSTQLRTAPRAAAAGPGRLSRGALVLIIDDNRDTREILCELLEREGFRCRTAASGDAGLALIDEISPDAAFVDLGLPGLDGFELARRVRTDPKHARMLLVALTGYGRTGERVEAAGTDFDEHLVKPVEVTTLLRVLRGEPNIERARGVN